MTVLSKFQKTLLKHLFIIFVNLAYKIKEPIKTSNFDKMRQFVMKKFQQTPFFNIL